MSIDYSRLKVEGIYKQREEGYLMLRLKVPAGIFSVEQALKVCDISDRYSNGILHLTTRGSIEIHWIRYEDLPQIQRMMATVGLTSRGACGGAVRSITCSTTVSGSFAVSQVLARKLHGHFTGNPHFENFPKKFKIGVDGGYEGSHYLIQDVGLVFVGREGDNNYFDVWTAGGLGRDPQAAILLEKRVPEDRIVPIVEAVARIYQAHTPPGKRLKHLLRDIGEERFRQILDEQLEKLSVLAMNDGFEKALTSVPSQGRVEWVEAVVFAGQIGSEKLRKVATIVSKHAGGFLVVSADQNITFPLSDIVEQEEVRAALAAAGFDGQSIDQRVSCRICPGSHQCPKGLAPTRDVAKKIIAATGPKGRNLSWAVSGCSNSCAHPQLADVGILVSKLVRQEDGSTIPLFNLLRRRGQGLGVAELKEVSIGDLLQAVTNLQ